MLDLIIRGAEVVTPGGAGRWDIGVVGEKIAFVALPDQRVQAGRTIDASGKIVVPGGIEPHAHLGDRSHQRPDAGLSTLGPEEDTRGMAFGGTTTHLDFCCSSETNFTAGSSGGQRWKGQSYVDYSFHVAIGGALPLESFDQMRRRYQAGISELQDFHHGRYAAASQARRLRLDMGRVQLAMEKVAKHDGIMVVHAEDDDLVQFNYESFTAEGRTEGWNMHLVHTKLSEELAFTG